MQFSSLNISKKAIILATVCIVILVGAFIFYSQNSQITTYDKAELLSGDVEVLVDSSQVETTYLAKGQRAFSAAFQASAKRFAQTATKVNSDAAVASAVAAETASQCDGNCDAVGVAQATNADCDKLLPAKKAECKAKVSAGTVVKVTLKKKVSAKPAAQVDSSGFADAFKNRQSGPGLPDALLGVIDVYSFDVCPTRRNATTNRCELGVYIAQNGAQLAPEQENQLRASLNYTHLPLNRQNQCIGSVVIYAQIGEVDPLIRDGFCRLFPLEPIGGDAGSCLYVPTFDVNCANMPVIEQPNLNFVQLKVENNSDPLVFSWTTTLASNSSIQFRQPVLELTPNAIANMSQDYTQDHRLSIPRLPIGTYDFTLKSCAQDQPLCNSTRGRLVIVELPNHANVPSLSEACKNPDYANVDTRFTGLKGVPGNAADYGIQSVFIARDAPIIWIDWSTLPCTNASIELMQTTEPVRLISHYENNTFTFAKSKYFIVSDNKEYEYHIKVCAVNGNCVEETRQVTTIQEAPIPEPVQGDASLVISPILVSRPVFQAFMHNYRFTFTWNTNVLTNVSLTMLNQSNNYAPIESGAVRANATFAVDHTLTWALKPGAFTLNLTACSEDGRCNNTNVSFILYANGSFELGLFAGALPEATPLDAGLMQANLENGQSRPNIRDILRNGVDNLNDLRQGNHADAVSIELIAGESYAARQHQNGVWSNLIYIIRQNADSNESSVTVNFSTINGNVVDDENTYAVVNLYKVENRNEMNLLMDLINSVRNTHSGIDESLIPRDIELAAQLQSGTPELINEHSLIFNNLQNHVYYVAIIKACNVNKQCMYEITGSQTRLVGDGTVKLCKHELIGDVCKLGVEVNKFGDSGFNPSPNVRIPIEELSLEYASDDAYECNFGNYVYSAQLYGFAYNAQYIFENGAYHLTPLFEDDLDLCGLGLSLIDAASQTYCVEFKARPEACDLSDQDILNGVQIGLGNANNANAGNQGNNQVAPVQPLPITRRGRNNYGAFCQATNSCESDVVGGELVSYNSNGQTTPYVTDPTSNPAPKPVPKPVPKSIPKSVVKEAPIEETPIIEVDTQNVMSSAAIVLIITFVGLFIVLRRKV